MKPSWLTPAVLALCAAAAAAAGAGAAGAGAPPAESAPPKAGAAAYGPGPVFVLPVKDGEDGSSVFEPWNATFLKRCLDRARDAGAALVLVEITTDGGRLDAAENMAKFLSDFEACPTAVLVQDRALSAGAFVTLACDTIYMQPASRIGAATPWVPSSTGVPVKLPEKIDEKFLRDTTVSLSLTAKKNGHNTALAAAMVDPDIEVVAVRDGDVVVPMTRDDFEAARTKTGSRMLIEEAVIVKKGKILILSTDEALTWSLAKAQVADRKEILTSLGLAGREVCELVPTWGEKLARFFSSGIVIGAMITVAMLALYMELHKPTGVGAGVFLTALAVYFWAHYLAGTAGPASIFIFLLGVALLIVEIFFIPGFGWTGIAGIALMVIGMIAARLPADFFKPALPVVPSIAPKPVRWTALVDAITPLAAGMALGCVGILVLMRYFPSLPLFNRLVLRTSLASAVVNAAQAAGAASPEAMVGLVGTTTTTLRPGGTARFGDKLLDVVSDSDFIEAGTQVRIVSASSNRVVVRRG